MHLWMNPVQSDYHNFICAARKFNEIRKDNPYEFQLMNLKTVSTCEQFKIDCIKST